jgi:hypothetical protein
LALAVKIVQNWTQEIFCDLFAIRLLGPAFSFALVEILSMLGFLSSKLSVKFNPTHPASACRFAEHVNMLTADSWMEAIKDIKSEQKKLLEAFAMIPRSRYNFYLDDTTRGPQALVNAFLDSVIPAIRKLVHELTPESNFAVRRFGRVRHDIEECLKVGVVPIMQHSNSPDPVSLINSAFCFYLTSLPEVITNFEGPGADRDVDIYSKWTRRLEMWTMKAIEDSQIQDRYRRLKRTVSWSFQKKKS